MARCRICDLQIGCKSSSSSDIVILCMKEVEQPCEDHAHFNCEYYCENCYTRRHIDLQSLIKEFGGRSREKEDYQIVTKKLDEVIQLLRNWSFVRGEDSAPSGTGDVIICTLDGSRFLAHSMILRNRSDVFRSMLEEVDAANGKKTRLMLIQEKVGGDSVKAFLNLLYTGQLSDEDMRGNYKELVKLAHLYKVKFILVSLDQFISKHVLTRDTVVEVAKMAYSYQLETTKEAALTVIADYPNHELFDLAFKELQAVLPLMAYKLFQDMVNLEYFITPDLDT